MTLFGGAFGLMRCAVLASSIKCIIDVSCVHTVNVLQVSGDSPIQRLEHAWFSLEPRKETTGSQKEKEESVFLTSRPPQDPGRPVPSTTAPPADTTAANAAFEERQR